MLEETKMGRPTLRTPEVIEHIITELSKGIPLTTICKAEGMPADRTVRDWVEADEALSADIARAREAGFDAIASECLEIADDGTNDYVEKIRQDGSTDVALDSEHVQRSKLRIETRLKLLSKWDPKRYGERLALAGDTDVPLRINITNEDAGL